MKLTIILMLLSCLVSNAQTDTIPFVLTSFNNIIIQAEINDKDSVDLMFHTAVGSVGITAEAAARIDSKRKLETTDVESWGGKSDAQYSENNTLQIGNHSWDSLRVWSGAMSGQFSDGKFGPNLFEGSIIELNFDKSLMVIHSILPAEVEEYSKFSLEIDRGSMFISGTCNSGSGVQEQQFMIHSGYGGTILLDNEFASKSGMNSLDVLDVSELKDSFGNIIKKNKAVLPEFTLETFDFKALPMGFFEGNIGGQQKSILGGELLKRFNMFFDVGESMIYLKPNMLMDLPFKDG